MALVIFRSEGDDIIIDMKYSHLERSCISWIGRFKHWNMVLWNVHETETKGFSSWYDLKTFPGLSNIFLPSLHSIKSSTEMKEKPVNHIAISCLKECISSACMSTKILFFLGRIVTQSSLKILESFYEGKKKSVEISGKFM